MKCTTALLKGAKRSRSPSTSSSSSSSRTSTRMPGYTPVAAFLFRRDFRLHDNTAFLSLFEAAAKVSLPILPLFFFNPLQADRKKNPYFSPASFQFMCQSLEDLNAQQLHGRLICLRGSDEKCMNSIKKRGVDIRLLGFNLDFTPFARQRDRVLQQRCEKLGIEVHTAPHDYSLLGLDQVQSGSGGSYSVFTPFYRRVLAEYASHIPPVQPAPATGTLKNRIWAEAPQRLENVRVDPSTAFTPMPDVTDMGGRERGVALLAQVRRHQHYGAERNGLGEDRTTHWSPHLKFGTLSCRECWFAVIQAFGRQHDLARQLIWREFYCSLIYHHPELVLGQLQDGDGKGSRSGSSKRNQTFQKKYAEFEWKWEEKHFEAFKTGRTGVPLVDAGVRCLRSTGWCPNRCRMVVANFLVKTLGVDWREGERWYASLAVDYDVANNSGGWQWSSGQGADAQPFFRTFNPFRQSSRFDPDCVFIHRWVPELREVPPATIHSWDEVCDAVNAKSKNRRALDTPAVRDALQNYGRPIVNIKTGNAAVFEAFKAFNASEKKH